MSAAVLALLLAAPAQAPAGGKALAALVDPVLKPELPDLVALYKHLHANPELSLKEEKSAARMAAELRKAGFRVTEKVGGHGVVGVLANGPGPTVLVRADMDALPVTERTGLPYASTLRAPLPGGGDSGVMHACGHDVHMTSFVGAARALAALKEQWAGTLVFMAQPAEEIGVGAKAMLDAGLLERFPRPDFAVALHAEPRLPAGVVAYTEGLTMANVDSVDVTVKGRGGHGSAPHLSIDPVVLAARMVLDFQTIVSREVNPIDPAVVTVGAIHGGTKHNIIPNEVKLQITVRTMKDSVRDLVLKSIDRHARACASGAGAPPPEVKVALDEYTPATINEPKLTKRLMGTFRDVLGAENVRERPPILGGEDFGRIGRAGVPACMYFLGTVDPARYEASKRPGASELPGMHSDSYAPLPEASAFQGGRTLAVAALELLGKK